MRTLGTLTKHVAAPPERVFAAYADIANAPSRIKSILRVEVLTPGPVGVGTKFKETRKMFGKECTETMEFTAFEPNERDEIGALTCGVEIRMEFRFTPEAGGTRVDVTKTSTATTFLARIMGPIFDMLMTGTMKKCIQGDLDAMAASVESVPV